MINYRIGFMALLITMNSYCQIKLKDIKVSNQFIPASNYLMPYQDTLNLSDGKVYSHKRMPSQTQQSRINLELNVSLSASFDTTTGSVKLWDAMINSDHMLLHNRAYNEKVFPGCLSATSVTITHIRSLKNQWAFMGILSAGINTDYIKVDANDIFMMAGSLWVKTFSPGFSLGVGLMVHNSFGKPLPWPLITANWNIGKKYKLNIDIPDKGPGLAYKISLRYQKNEKTDASLYFKPSTTAYDISYMPADKRLLNYWQIPIGAELQTHARHFDVSYNCGLMALRSFGYADKKISEMFARYPYHQLRANMFFGINLKYKL